MTGIYDQDAMIEPDPRPTSPNDFHRINAVGSQYGPDTRWGCAVGQLYERGLISAFLKDRLTHHRAEAERWAGLDLPERAKAIHHRLIVTELERIVAALDADRHTTGVRSV